MNVTSKPSPDNAAFGIASARVALAIISAATHKATIEELFVHIEHCCPGISFHDFYGGWLIAHGKLHDDDGPISDEDLPAYLMKIVRENRVQ